MHCPECGQHQPSNNVQYCTRCGAPLRGFLSLRRNHLVAGSALLISGAVVLPFLEGVLEGAIGRDFAQLVSFEAVLNIVYGALAIWGLYLIISTLIKEKRLRRAERREGALLKAESDVLPASSGISIPGLEGKVNGTSRHTQPSTAAERTTELLKDDDDRSKDAQRQ